MYSRWPAKEGYSFDFNPTLLENVVLSLWLVKQYEKIKILKLLKNPIDDACELDCFQSFVEWLQMLRPVF